MSKQTELTSFFPMECISKWNELTSFPFKHVPPPFGVEHQQFMIATSQHHPPSTECMYSLFIYIYIYVHHKQISYKL